MKRLEKRCKYKGDIQPKRRIKSVSPDYRQRVEFIANDTIHKMAHDKDGEQQTVDDYKPLELPENLSQLEKDSWNLF